MDNLSLRKVQDPHASNNYRVILKTEHDGEFEIGLQCSDTAWTWAVNTVVPRRNHCSIKS
jgi:hypothetical protein